LTKETFEKKDMSQKELTVSVSLGAETQLITLSLAVDRASQPYVQMSTPLC